VFGLSIGEIMLLLIVGIVVVGPKNLPTLMRTAGQWVTKIRRMSSDLRNQSGIDDLIRQEGLEREIHELRSLSRMNVVDSLISPALTVASAPRPAPVQAPAFKRIEPLREREYPLVGCDAGGALADDAVIYPPPPAEPAAAPSEAALAGAAPPEAALAEAAPTPRDAPEADAKEASPALAAPLPLPGAEDRQESPSA
jgi:sec-independent protein translocase protein TatB